MDFSSRLKRPCCARPELRLCQGPSTTVRSSVWMCPRVSPMVVLVFSSRARDWRSYLPVMRFRNWQSRRGRRVRTPFQSRDSVVATTGSVVGFPASGLRQMRSTGHRSASGRPPDAQTATIQGHGPGSQLSPSCLRLLRSPLARGEFPARYQCHAKRQILDFRPDVV